MTAAELAQWLARHGGRDDTLSTRSMAGQEIIFAKDGAKVVLTRLTPDAYRIDDIYEPDNPEMGPVAAQAAGGAAVASGGSAPAAAPAAVPEAPAAAPSPAAPAPATGNTITQDQLNALVQQYAPGGDVNGWDFRRGTRTKEVEVPARPGVPASRQTVQVPYVLWIDRKTGRTLEYEVQPGGGSYIEVTNGIVEGNKNPDKPGDRPQTVATNTTEPFIVTRMPDGTLKSEPNPNYKGPEQKPGTLISVKGGDGKTYLIPVDAQGKPGRAVDAGVPADAPKPDKVTVDGVVYIQQPDGTYKPAQGIPNPNAPVTGPSLPQIMVGHATATLQAIGEQLARDPNLTAAQRERLWAQAIQVANMAVQEAGIKQREAESNLNAQVNIATAIGTLEQNAFNNALKVASDLNDKLPVGSPLGGQAFAAMLGMSLIMAKRSGIYDIKPPGTPVTDASKRPPPPPPPVNVTDKAAVEAARQQTQAGLQAAQGQPPAGAAAPSAPGAAAGGGERDDDLLDFATQSGGQQTMTRAQFNALPSDQQAYLRPFLVNARANPARSAAQPGTPAAPTAGGQSPLDQQQAAAAASGSGLERDDDILTIYRLAGGVTEQMTRAEYNQQVREGRIKPGDVQVVNAQANPARSAGGAPAVPAQPAAPEPPQTRAGGGPPVGPSAPVGGSVIPPPAAPAAPADTTTVVPGVRNDGGAGDASDISGGMAPAQPRFAALAMLQPQQQPPQQPVSVEMGQPGTVQPPAAMLRAQALSKPPWRMTPDEIAQYEAAGISPEDIYSVPGFPMAGRVA